VIPIVVTAVATAFAAHETKGTADWSLFRGNPLQTGVTDAPLPDQLEIIWKLKTKEGIEGTAAIVNGTVYIGSLDEHLYALDLPTGKEKWKYKAVSFKAPASVRDGRVYIGDGDGVFHCVDAATGHKVWTYTTGAEIAGGANFSGDSVLFGSGDETLSIACRKTARRSGSSRYQEALCWAHRRS
jgi:outer membrane protein assembly factor BamB